MEKSIYQDIKMTICENWVGIFQKFGKEDLLPLWVADMDFQAPECVGKALQEYAKKGVFGYYKVPESFFEAFINWEKERHGYHVEKEWIRFAPGVVPALFWLVQCFTEKEDSVMISTPAYPPFFHCIEDNGRKVTDVPLKCTDGHYEMDYDKMEKIMREEQVKMYILCSPHNPIGRVWKEEELRRLISLCEKYHVLLVADEIHQDIILKGNRQIPAGSIGQYTDKIIALTAASKTFNLADCQNAFILLADEKLREEFDDFAEKIHVMQGSGFGYIAVQNAYEGGLDWLNGVLKIIEENYVYARHFIERELPEAVVSELQGTYLMWIDLKPYLQDKDVVQTLQEKCHLAIDYGDWFGGEDWKYYIRVNLATKTENIAQAMENLKRGLE